MNLTKRQKMLSAVFLLGLVGLVADRTILRPQGGPSAASAQSVSETPSAVGPSDSVPAADSAAAPATVAERLNRLLSGPTASPDELRNPFSMPPSWSGTGATTAEKPPDTTDVFLRKHQLKAVVMQGQEACAQIDDSFLVPGQSVDGFKLLSVNERTAVFEREGKQAILELVSK